LCIVIGLSLLKKGHYGQVQLQIDFTNFGRVFEPLYLNIFFRSLGLAIFTTLSCLIFGLPFAYFMARSSLRLKTLCLGLVIIPFWTNFIIRIYALKLVLGENGIINNILLSLNLIQTPLSLVDNTFGLAVGMLYNYLPFMILPLFVSLDRLDFTLLDAAYDLGANRLRMITKILLPLISPGILTGCLFVFIPAFGEFVIPDLLGGAQSIYVGSLITEAFLKSRDWPFGSALSSVIVIFTLISFYIQSSRTTKKYREQNQIHV
jgi:spermidine/putrescine transport system permease protein